MTNSGSTIISPLTMTTIDLNLRSTSKKELEHSGQCGGSSVEEDAALVNAENEIHLSHDEEIDSLDSNGNPIVDTEKVENRMLTVALVNSVVQSSASTSSSDLNKNGGGEEAEEDSQCNRYSLRKRTRSFAGSSSGGEESPCSQSNKTAKSDAVDKPNSPRSPGGSRISKRLQTKTLKAEEQLQQSQPPSRAQSQSQSESNAQPQLQSQPESQSQSLPPTQSQTPQQAQAPAAVPAEQPTIPTAPVPPPPVLPVKIEPPAPVVKAPVVKAPVVKAPVVQTPVVRAQAPPQARIQAPPIKVEMRTPQPNPVAVKDPTLVPNPLLGMSTPPVAPFIPQTTAGNTTAVLPQQQKIIKTEIPSVKRDPSSSSSSIPAAPAPLAPAPPVACPLPAQPAPSMQVTVKVEEATLPVKQEEQVIQRRGRIFSIDIDPAGLDFPDLGIVDAMNQQSELCSSAPLPPISSTVSGGGGVAPSNDHSHSQHHHHHHSNGVHNAPPPAPPTSHPPATDVPQIEVKAEPTPEPPSMLPDDMDVNTDFLTGGRDRAMSFEFFSFGINADEPLPPAPELPDHSGGRPRGDSIIFDPCSFRDGGVLEEGFFKSRGNSIDIGVTEEMNIMNTPGFAPAPASVSHHDPHHHANSHLPSADPSASLPPPPAAPSTGPYILPSQTVPAPPAVHAPPRAQPLSSVPAPLGTTTTTTTTNSYGTTTTTTTTTTVTGATAKTMGVTGGGSGGGVVPPGNGGGGGGGGGAAGGGNVQMATLPSSLSGSSMSHSTFQMELLNKDGRIGIYLPEARKARIAKFHSKRKMRIWRKRIKYDCRKKLADSRPRIKGRFVKRSDMEEDEEL